MNDNEELLTVRQVARYLQFEESTVYSWAQDEKIPAIKIGRSWRFRYEDIRGWIQEHSREGV